jgi:hypothetical protein
LRRNIKGLGEIAQRKILGDNARRFMNCRGKRALGSAAALGYLVLGHRSRARVDLLTYPTHFGNSLSYYHNI